jgi:hypothetical protein
MNPPGRPLAIALRAMRVKPAQVLPLMLLLACMFGCKGAGQVLKVVGAVAVATVRVAAIAAAASAHNHHVEANGGSGTASAEPTEAQLRAQEIADNAPGGCTELFVEMVPPPPPGTVPPRAADCGGNVLIQDADGHWHRHGDGAVPAIEAP